MDLGKYNVKAAADSGAVLHIKHPSTGEKLFDNGEPVTVTVIGRDSPKVQEAMQAVEKRKAKGEDIDAEEQGLTLFCAVVVGWSHIGLDGEELECTPANVRKVFSDERTDWIGEQVGPFVLSRRNFAKNLPAD